MGGYTGSKMRTWRWLMDCTVCFPKIVFRQLDGHKGKLQQTYDRKIPDVLSQREIVIRIRGRADDSASTRYLH